MRPLLSGSLDHRRCYLVSPVEGGGLFVFVRFSDNRWFAVFVRFVIVALLFFVIVGSRGGARVPTRLIQVKMLSGSEVMSAYPR
jgi:hypothetical protein